MMYLREAPALASFQTVVAWLPDDQKRQIEAATGFPFSADGAAVGNFIQPGPKWGLYDAIDDYPLAVGGFIPAAPVGVWRDWLLCHKRLFNPAEHLWRPATRLLRGLIDGFAALPDVRRIECYSHASRTDAHRWYRLLGYRPEGVLRGWMANGDDVVVFARVRDRG